MRNVFPIQFKRALANVPEFTIQPHPAKTNDPRDLQRELAGGGSQGGAANVFNTPGLNVPSAQVAEGLEKPKSREEVCCCVRSVLTLNSSRPR